MHRELMTLNTYRLRMTTDACIDHGYAVGYRILWPETAGVLARLANALAYAPSRDLVVPQRFTHAGFYAGEWPDEIGWLVDRTEELVLARARRRARIGLMQWRVNDIAIQKYDPNDADGGIGWHRDFASDKHLVVVYTVQGKAVVWIDDKKGGKREYLIKFGDAMLLVAPDPISGDDPRLRHCVGKALDDESRISIALRMNITDSDGGQGYDE